MREVRAGTEAKNTSTHRLKKKIPHNATKTSWVCLRVSDSDQNNSIAFTVHVTLWWTCLCDHLTVNFHMLVPGECFSGVT